MESNYTRIKGKEFLQLLTELGDNLIVNRKVIKLLGAETAVFLGELIAKYSLWEERDDLDKDGFFYCTENKIKELTSWGWEKQNKMLKKLEDNGVLERVNRGLPLKRYVKLNLYKIIDLYRGTVNLNLEVQ